MSKKRCMLFVFSVLAMFCIFTIANAETEWTEADFAFYDDNMSVIERPSATSEMMGYYVNLKEDEPGQTFRGLKVGCYYEELAKKYDLTDAEWTIYDTDDNAKYGESDRSKALTEKWKAQGKTGADVLAMSDFLCAKGYYFYIKLAIYREDGHFKTKSQLLYDDYDAELYETTKEELISQQLARSDNTYTREELEQKYDEYYEQYFPEEYLREHYRAEFKVRIRDSKIQIIEISDNYYSWISSAFNDDGTVNDSYAYVLKLKDTGNQEWEMAGDAEKEKEKLKEQYPLEYASLIEKYAQENGIDKAFVAAVIRNESSYNSEAESATGARGLMQLPSDMAEWIAGKIGDENYSFDQMFDPETNIKYGCWYLGQLYKYYNGDYSCVACANHAGANQVTIWLGNTEYSSDGKTITIDNLPDGPTKSYAQRIMRDYEVYSGLDYWNE